MRAPPRPYHHGNLREALLEAAEKALESGGPQSLSLRELSRALGVSYTAPTRHFAEKQELLDMLAVRGFKRLGSTLDRATKVRGQDFRARLTKLARAYVGFAAKQPALFGWMFEAKDREGAPAELSEAGDQALAPIPAIFAEGQLSGEVVPGDPERQAMMAFAALHGLVGVSSYCAFKDTSLDVLVPEMLEGIVLGLQPRR